MTSSLPVDLGHRCFIRASSPTQVRFSNATDDESLAPASTSTKKRKLDKFAETTSNLNTDDEKALKNIKAKSSTMVKVEVVKADPRHQEEAQRLHHSYSLEKNTTVESSALKSRMNLPLSHVPDEPMSGKPRPLKLMSDGYVVAKMYGSPKHQELLLLYGSKKARRRKPSSNSVSCN